MPRLTILITAGPTREPIDPVRYISNHSSGKMGYALASASQKMGHKVILISGPTSLPIPGGVKRIDVKTAREMHASTLRHFQSADVIIGVAAVADYRPVKIPAKKIKKTGHSITLKLIPNPDILADVGLRKKKNQILVGFAAETDSLFQNAKKKLRAKNCDWIVANRVGLKGVGFGSDQNRVTLLGKKGEFIRLKKMSKTKISQQILKIILKNK